MRHRVLQIAMAAGALGCGPTVADVPSADASSDTSSATDVFDPSTEEVTTEIADTSSSESGEPIVPGCETPGSCNEACVQWEEIVESATGSWIERIAIAPDGTVFAIEARQGAGDEALVSLLRSFDVAGEPLFEEELLAQDPDITLSVSALAVSTAGAIAIVQAEKLDEQSFRASLDVRTPDGMPHWGTTLGTDVSRVGGAVAFGGDGSIVVGGIQNEGLSWAGFLIAHTADGEARWQRDSDELGINYGGVVAIAPASPTDFVLTGADDGDLWLARIDLDGVLSWRMQEPDDATLMHAATDIGVSAEGEVLVVGSEYSGSGYPVPWLGRFAADGNAIASVAYDEIANGPHGLDGIEIADDGRIFVAGIRVNDSGGTSRHVLELACDGTAAWEWTHTNPQGYDYANGGGLAWSSAGLVVGGSDYVGDDFMRRGFLARLVP